MTIIDAHVHLWDPATTPREVSILNKVLGFSPRLLDSVAGRVFPRKALEFFGSPRYITRPYLPEDYRRDSGGHNVRGIVHVEAGWKGKGNLGPVGETEWLASVNTDADPKIMAIVVHADLARGEGVGELLEAHLAASPLVRGAREILTWQPGKRILNGADSPDRIRDARWRKGLETLARYDLSFEATIYDNQIGDLAELAADFPGMKIMLSHLATPVAVAGPFGDRGKTDSDRARTFEEWKDGLSRLAEQPNVHVKLSGLAMPVCGFGWHTAEASPSAQQAAAALAPFLEHAVAVFGADRCLFASNFPIDKVSLPLSTLIEAYGIVLGDLPDDQRHRIFCANALEFYRIDSIERDP